ncbi:MAG: N-acetylneuraminate synthase [Pseudomonadota bacterium]|nr:N-acetylneuraminate synthase [Pseudomonadota bacterium]
MSRRVTVIAEAGVNHNGRLDLALDLVDAAAAAGADYVKFQTFDAAKLVTAAAPKADYQARQTGAGESQRAMLERLQLSEADHRALMERCTARGIRFLSTPFDAGSLDLLARTFALPVLKIGSGELTNGPFLLDLARTGRDLILSTGMGTLAEVEAALGVLAFGYLAPDDARPGPTAFAATLHDPAAWATLRERVTLLHCASDYPAAPAAVNLKAMDTMADAFGIPVGYSDHTLGSAVTLAAVARGAVMIEKHLTLDRTMDGPDHAASMEPAAFTAMVADIRAIGAALGTGIKQPAPSELSTRAVARKSLVAARPLKAGTVIGPGDIAVMRPGTGRSPMDYWSTIGRVLDRDLAEGEPLEP